MLIILQNVKCLQCKDRNIMLLILEYRTTNIGFNIRCINLQHMTIIRIFLQNAVMFKYHNCAFEVVQIKKKIKLRFSGKGIIRKALLLMFVFEFARVVCFILWTKLVFQDEIRYYWITFQYFKSLTKGFQTRNKTLLVTMQIE